MKLSSPKEMLRRLVSGSEPREERNVSNSVPQPKYTMLVLRLVVYAVRMIHLTSSLLSTVVTRIVNGLERSKCELRPIASSGWVDKMFRMDVL